MKLVDMKRTAAERKKSNTLASPGPYMGDEYGYGLRLCLDTEEINKLGLKMPDVGEEFRIEAVGTVTEVSANASSTNKRKRIEFQLRKIGVQKGGERSMIDAINKGIKDAS